MLSANSWLWIGFNIFVLAMLALDLGIFHRKAHAISIKEASIWSLVWIALAMIFNAGIYSFSVPVAYQHRVLFWGVLGALVLRGMMIALGVVLLETFHWIIYLFGAFLLFIGIRMCLHKEAEVHPERNPLLKLVRRIVPVTRDYEGDRFM